MINSHMFQTNFPRSVSIHGIQYCCFALLYLTSASLCNHHAFQTLFFQIDLTINFSSMTSVFSQFTRVTRHFLSPLSFYCLRSNANLPPCHNFCFLNPQNLTLRLKHTSYLPLTQTHIHIQGLCVPRVQCSVPSLAWHGPQRVVLRQGLPSQRPFHVQPARPG